MEQLMNIWEALSGAMVLKKTEIWKDEEIETPELAMQMMKDDDKDYQSYDYIVSISYNSYR
jgi:hypothetical protein